MLCVYTTLQDEWVKPFSKADTPAFFQSVHTWKSAKELLQTQQSVPVLIRESGANENETFMYDYKATLKSVRLSETFTTHEERRTWLESHLTLQKNHIKANKLPKYETWQDQFEDWELKFGDKANTWFELGNLEKIEPIYITQLIKKSNGEPLANNYGRGYAICYYPGNIQIIV